MNRFEADQKILSKSLAETMCKRFPLLSEQTVLEHAEAAVSNMTYALMAQSDYKITGAMSKDIVFVYRVEHK